MAVCTKYTLVTYTNGSQVKISVKQNVDEKKSIVYIAAVRKVMKGFEVKSIELMCDKGHVFAIINGPVTCKCRCDETMVYIDVPKVEEAIHLHNDAVSGMKADVKTELSVKDHPKISGYLMCTDAKYQHLVLRKTNEQITCVGETKSLTVSIPHFGHLSDDDFAFLLNSRIKCVIASEVSMTEFEHEIIKKE
jgi:hypothetical protein